MNTTEVKLMEINLKKNEEMTEARIIHLRAVRDLEEQIRAISNQEDELKNINKLIMEYQERKREFRKDLDVCKEYDAMIQEAQEKKKNLLECGDNSEDKKRELERKLKELKEDYSTELMQIDNRFQRRKIEYFKEIDEKQKNR